MLEVNGLQAGYGALQVLWDVSLRVAEGEFVALIGPNGAGKTTTLRTVAGLVKPLAGDITFQGKSVIGRKANHIARSGISFVTETLDLFEGMSVRDNLVLGAFSRRDRQGIAASLALVYELFPLLAERRKQLAGTLSGGERKMLAIGRGLMLNPRLLLVDEPSLGLAPLLVQTVLRALQQLSDQGLTILLVEQNVNTTLHLTDHAYVLENGRIVLHGPSGELLKNTYLQQTYIGVQAGPVQEGEPCP